MYTLPGALLLAGLEMLLIRQRVRRLLVELVVLALGATVGAGILALLFPDAFVVESWFLGALYGLATAGSFVVFQRVIGGRLHE